MKTGACFFLLNVSTVLIAVACELELFHFLKILYSKVKTDFM